MSGFVDLFASFDFLIAPTAPGGGGGFYRLAINGAPIPRTTGTLNSLLNPPGSDLETGAVNKRVAIVAGQTLSLQWARAGAAIRVDNLDVQYANLLGRFES